MVQCPNNHDNLDGLISCRICGLPLLELRAEFSSLINSLSCRADMGCAPPRVVTVGLGKLGSNIVEICGSSSPIHPSDSAFLAVDTCEPASENKSGAVRRLALGSLTPNAGTFCGIGETVTKSDPNLMPVLRMSGLGHKDTNQVALFVAGIGGGIGSAPFVLVEKCRQLNPGAHTVVLVVLPGVDESFHNHLNAFYGLSRLLDDGRQEPDMIVAVNFDRIKLLRGVGAGGQELSGETLLAGLISLFIENVTSRYLAEMVRINRSVGVKLVVPCLALGRSVEIFGGLTNILESAITYPANYACMESVLTCHLLIRMPEHHAKGFAEDKISEELRSLARRHFPSIKATSSSITWSDAQHDRVEACILLGGDSAMCTLFGDSNGLAGFRRELDGQRNWQTYGLDEGDVKHAGAVMAGYDPMSEQSRTEKKEKKAKLKRPGF